MTTVVATTRPRRASSRRCRCWAGVVLWPGGRPEGNRELQPLLDAKPSEEQLGALGEALSAKHGDTLFEIVAFICPTVHEPIVAPFEFEFDLESRRGRL